MKNLNLKNLIQNICKGSYSQAELIQFITITQKIALSYLKYQEITGKRISGANTESETELQDIAMDCIADLFMSDGNGSFPQLERYYNSKIENPNLDEAETLTLTRRLVIRKTRQELSRIFRERDPEGAKIVRNIKVAIRNSNMLMIMRDFGKDFICYADNQNHNKGKTQPSDEKLRKNMPVIPDDLLASEFSDLHNIKDPISISVKKLLDIVADYEQYQNFLAIEVISRLLRNIRVEQFRDGIMNMQLVFSPLQELELKEIDDHVDDVMKIISKKIHAQYLSSGKISPEKAVIYNSALRDVLYGLLQRRNGGSYFCHLKSYITSLTQKQYREQERSIFEYLAKIAKKEFRKKLLNLL